MSQNSMTPLTLTFSRTHLFSSSVTRATCPSCSTITKAYHRLQPQRKDENPAHMIIIRSVNKVQKCKRDVYEIQNRISTLKHLTKAFEANQTHEKYLNFLLIISVHNICHIPRTQNKHDHEAQLNKIRDHPSHNHQIFKCQK